MKTKGGNKGIQSHPYLIINKIILLLLRLPFLLRHHLVPALDELVRPERVDPLPQHLAVELQEVAQVILTHACRSERDVQMRVRMGAFSGKVEIDNAGVMYIHEWKE